LQREARVGLLVQHPYLVRTLYTHVTCAPYFLVLELLPGDSLRRVLRKAFRFDVPKAVWITRQTAQALEGLHRAGFMHGDVKPDNIRLVDDGTAKLIDLGFAHRPGENVEFLKSGYILGTVNYLAPEICALESVSDCRSDLYSLGVTLYEMLTGHLPYPRGSVRETFRRHCDEPPTDPRRYAPDLPDPVLNLLDSLLARCPQQRLPNATTLVQQLIPLELAALGRKLTA
jgi:serine/threonine protein kinase